MRFRPGDLLTVIRSDDSEHYVYELLDDKGGVFYVGRSCVPQTRLYQHSLGSGNSRVTAKIKDCWEPRLRIVSCHQTAKEAHLSERAHIDSFPKQQLLNQDERGRTASYTRLPIFEQFRPKT